MSLLLDTSETHRSRTWRWPFLLAITVLLVCGGIAGVLYTRFAAAADKVEHTRQVMASIDSVIARLIDAETGQRGYLLTKDPSFLRSYEGVQPETRALLSQLEQLIADNPGQMALSRRLAALAEERVSEMARVLALDESDLPAARTLMREGHGRRIMDDIRSIAADMRTAEGSLLSQRYAQEQLARRGALTFALVSLLVAVALGLVAVSVERNFARRRAAFAQEMSARVTAEREATEAAAGLQESESFNRSILDHSGDCIQVLESDSRVVLVNRPGLALLEIDDPDTWRGQPWTSLWQGEDGLARKAIDDAVSAGEGRFQTFRPTAKGTPKWWDVIVTPIRDDAGHVQKLVAVSRDITEQKAAEQERALLLASERAARSEAERAARMKDDFVSTLSHELRTPLNAILGWVGVLKHHQSPDTLAKAIDVIDRNSRRQSQMVDDLLDMSRIMSGKLRLDVQRVDVSSAIDEAVASAQPAAEAKGVRLVKVLGSAAIVQGDPGRLQQIVWNLVSNAIKFTPRGGLVQVTLRKVNSHVHVQVSDTGQGMRADVLPHVFQRFRQGDASSTRHHGGLGLGLAIVKNLAEMHGGSVEAASDGESLGSVFTVRLPLALATAAPPDPATDTLDLVPARFASLLDGLQVLVLDDEPDARDVVQRLLEDAGARVKTAASASEAMVSLEQGFLPDIIVSDIGMPDQDGYDFIRRVRGMDGAVAAVPAAALTALARLEDRKRALMAGYQTHLAKPVDPAELVAMVASLTGRTGRPGRPTA